MTYIIRTHDLSKSVQGQQLISEVSMNINRGQVYGFLGPNGSGKTTVMKMILNLVQPSRGSIELFGETVAPGSYHQLRRIGSMIEYPIFYEKLTAFENLHIHCAYMSIPHLDSIEKVLKLVGLYRNREQAVEKYSLGMKQRLGIARAMIAKPELLILDEPLNSLDQEGVEEVRDILRQLNREHGVTILMSSHRLDEMDKLVEAIGVIKKGKLLAEVTIEDVRRRHAGYIEVITRNAKEAAFVLQQGLGLVQVITRNDSIRISDNVEQRDVYHTLINHDIQIDSIRNSSGSLEDYYVELTQGDHDHD